MSVTGVETVLANLSRVADLSTRGAEVGVAEAAETILAASNANVPDLGGGLQGSGQVSASGLEAAVSYSAPYAVFQHERLDYAHDDGSAKFLESAPNPGQIQDAIAAQVRRALGT